MVELIAPHLAEAGLGTLDDAARERLARAMAGLKPRAKTIKELAEQAAFYIAPRPLALNPKAEKLLSAEARARLEALHPKLSALSSWDDENLEGAVRGFAEAEGLKLGQVAQPLRAALSGSNVSPGIFEVMVVLGREDSLDRIMDCFPNA